MDKVFAKINDLRTVLWVETALFLVIASVLFGVVIEAF